MINMKVKICGLKTTSDVDNCVISGADFIGLVFFEKSPRHLHLKQAEILSKHYAEHYSSSKIKKVALCVNPTNISLSHIIKAAQPDFLQLHGSESPSRIEEIKQKYGLPIIKAIRVKSKLDIAESQQYHTLVDWLLFDAAASSNELPGGNGRAFNWSLLKEFSCTIPWMLAGGLNPNNVADAIQQTSPDGVDVSSGVDLLPGKKDPMLISAFVQSAKMR